MSKRYSGKSFKDSSVMKKPKHSLKEKRRLKKEKKTNKKNWVKNKPTLATSTTFSLFSHYFFGFWSFV